MTMSVSEAELAARRARALAIANKFSSNGILGKHPRSDAPSWPVSDGTSHARDGNKVKIYLPKDKSQHFVDMLLVSGGEKLRQMERQSGAQLCLRGKGSSPGGNDECPDEDLHVLVEGQSESQVSAAERLINDLLFNKSTPADDSQRKPGTLVLSDRLYAADIEYLPFRGSGDKSRIINVAANAVGQIIGRGGETIKMLQMKTGAFIQVSRESDPSSNMKTVTIEGTQSQVDHAEDEIMRILHENEQKDQRGHGGLGFGADTTTEIIRIPHDAVGLLIGKGGLTIKQLQMRTGCNIQVQRDCDADPSAVTRDVTLTGTDKQIEDAKREVAALVQGHGTGLDMPLEAVAPGMIVITLMIPGTCVGGIIGKQGETIKAIQQRSGARVQVSRDASMPEREITVSGSEQAVQVAKAEIENIVADNQARESGTGSTTHRRTSYGEYGYDNDPYSRQAATYGSDDYYPYAGYYNPYQYYGYDPSAYAAAAAAAAGATGAAVPAPGQGPEAEQSEAAAKPPSVQQQTVPEQQQQPQPQQQPGAGSTDAQMQQWQAYCMQYYSYYGQYPPEAYAGQQQQQQQQTPVTNGSNAASPEPGQDNTQDPSSSNVTDSPTADDQACR